MKKLLILGAGIYQVPLIKKAKEMGIYTIAASYPGPYPGLALAHKVYSIDTTNSLELLKVAKAEKIDGVCTSGTDVAIGSIGTLCDTLNLPGISKKSAQMLTDKARMKEAFFAGGVSTPASIQVSSLKEALSAYHTLTPPVMVKAVDSSGSRGITKVSSLSQLEKAYLLAFSVTKKDYVLIEQFIDAPEIGVDGFVSHGTLQLFLPHQKFVYTTEGTTIPQGHAFPYPCSKELALELRHQIELVIQATGMDDCAFNADVLIKDKKVYILEAGGRAGATCIPELISIHCGFDYYEEIIKSSLGMPTDFSWESPIPCMAKLLFSPCSGILSYVDDSFLYKLKKQGIQASIDYSAGDSINQVRNGTDRIGQVIMKTDSESELNQVIEQLQTHIKIDGVTLDKL